MKFKTLTAKNFCRFQDITLPLENQGLVLVTGRNEDAAKASSNGAGKSSLLDAFVWCLWGSTIRGLKDDQVVNEQVGQDCFVEVVFTESGSTYTIQRCRKHSGNHKPNDVVLLVDGEDKSGGSMAATQAKITEILGLDFDTFCVMMPGAGLKAAEMTDKQVKLLLERLLQTDAVEGAYKLAREERQALAPTIAQATAQVAATTRSITEGTTRLAEYISKRDAFTESQNARIQKLEEERALLTKRLHACEEDRSQADSLAKTLQSIVNKLSSAEKEKDVLLQTKQSLFNSWKTSMSKLQAAVTQADVKYQATLSAIERLKSVGGECSACLQPVDDVRKALQLKALREQADKAQSVLTAAQLSYEESSSAYDEQFRSISDSINKVQAAINLHQLDKEKISEELQSKKQASSIIADLHNRLAALESQCDELHVEENPFGEMVDRLEAELKRLRIALSDQEELKQAQLAELEKLDFWVEAFSPAGIRSYMLAHTTPILNAAAAKYAELLTDNEMSVVFDTQSTQQSGKVVEKFNIKVSQKHGASVYAGNSTGERGRANLVIAFALGDLAAMRANKKIPFRFLDEPFEHIDEAGLDSVVKLLHQLESKYETVFVITHNNDFKQSFQKEITVVKSGGISHIEGL